MDFLTTLKKLEELDEAITQTPADILAAKKKQEALEAFKKKGKLKAGEDIMLDPDDKTGSKYKVVPQQIVKQASRAILSR